MENMILISKNEYDDLRAQISRLEATLKFYQHQLLQAKRRQFGVSSEKSDPNVRQLSLFDSEEVVAAPPALPETEEITYTRSKRKGKREEDLSGLPVERIDYELSEDQRACHLCGDTMRDVGVQTRRELKLIPAKVVVLEHAAHTYACRNCEQTGITVPFVKAQTPNPLISGSLASPSLVAHVAVQKYANAMPLYRLENGFRYDGVSISRQTMAHWLIQCSRLYLDLVYKHLKEYLLKESCLHSDETTMQVLLESGRAAWTKSYQWIYRTSGCSDRKIVIYEYQKTRSQEHPRAFLKDFKGFLHTDGYQAYHNLAPDITVVGCWAHARRKLEAVLKSVPAEKRKDSKVQQGMDYMTALFTLERRFQELTPEERYRRRLEESKPVADAFFAWAANVDELPKSPLGEAVSYALSQKKYLENVFLDGRTEFTNNRAERSVRPFVMGRKAWLFSCTPKGAEASSVIYSIIETAKENGLHPYRYMEFLLERLANSTCSEVESLLPWSASLPDYCRAPKEKTSGANDRKGV